MSRGAVTAVAAAAVLVSSADTYVIVLALPAMLGDLGLSLQRLQQATPIISGFLLGYVVVMPLLGRLSDHRGRRPILYTCLAVFAAGSLVTASAHDLASAVVGRALQGAGGGGLVPVTLALVADLWPASRRGLPLGVVGGAQELGSVVGPLYGALILSVATWRAIFWINLPLCAMLALGLAATSGMRARAQTRVDVIGIGLAAIAVAAAALAVTAPDALVSSVSIGTLFVPLAGAGWLTPMSLAAFVAALGFGGRRLHRRSTSRDAPAPRLDWPGALLLAAVLAAIVVSFSSTDPSREAIAPVAVVALPVALVCALAFIVRERRARNALVSLPMLRPRAAHGALLTNIFVGAALMAVLLDIPILARATAFPDSQLGAALVLLRLLAAVPVGAVAGGVLSRRFGNHATAAAGLALSTLGLALMTRFTATTLTDPFGASWLHPSDPVLVACGLGFGLAIAPVNSAILSVVRESLHGIAAALVVLARVTGMLVGVSVLTAIGLHAFFVTAASLPSAATLCPRTPLSCAPYNALVTGAIVDELRVVFAGAAVCAGIATLLALVMLRGGPAPPGAAMARG